jgi:hypothetical protein
MKSWTVCWYSVSGGSSDNGIGPSSAPPHNRQSLIGYDDGSIIGKYRSCQSAISYYASMTAAGGYHSLFILFAVPVSWTLLLALPGMVVLCSAMPWPRCRTCRAI